MNYNELFKYEFNILNVDVKNIDKNVLDETLKAFDNIYNKYPQLLNLICSYGGKKLNTKITYNLLRKKRYINFKTRNKKQYH